MIRLRHLILACVICCLSLGCPQAIYAQPEALETIPNGYAKDYLFFQGVKDEPQLKTREHLKSQSFGGGLKYVHRLESDWIVGLKLQRKPFIRRNDQPLSLLVFSNQTQGIFRIYHPFYVLVGTEVSYIMPVKKSSPPFVKDPEFSTEIGVGLNMSLWWLLTRRSTIEFHLSRWRGTKTNDFHAVELSLAYGIAI